MFRYRAWAHGDLPIDKLQPHARRIFAELEELPGGHFRRADGHRGLLYPRSTLGGTKMGFRDSTREKASRRNDSSTCLRELDSGVDILQRQFDLERQQLRNTFQPV